jgi:hypothetical protein
VGLTATVVAEVGEKAHGVVSGFQALKNKGREGRGTYSSCLATQHRRGGFGQSISHITFHIDQGHDDSAGSSPPRGRMASVQTRSRGYIGMMLTWLV